MDSSMQAVRFHAHGALDRLAVEPIPTPTPGDADVLVRVYAVGLNPVDANIVAGDYPSMLTGKPPRGLGIELAGEVVAVGAGVSRFAAGDRVLGSLGTFKGEALADYVLLPETDATLWPAAVTAAEAGAFPLAALTAYEGVVEKGRVRSNAQVLVNGASGGVGHLAVQLVAALGAHATGVASGDAEEFVSRMGAETFVDYRAQDVTALDARFDLVFDVAGTLDFDAAKAILAPHGHFVTTAVTPGHLALVAKTKVLPGPDFHVCQVAPNGRHLDLLVALQHQGGLRAHIDRAFEMAEVADAYRYLREGHPNGKVVLVLHEDLPRGGDAA